MAPSLQYLGARAAGVLLLLSVPLDGAMCVWAASRGLGAPADLLVRMTAHLVLGLGALASGARLRDWIVVAIALLELWPVVRGLAAGDLYLGTLALAGLRWGAFFQLLLARDGESGRGSAIAALCLLLFVDSFASAVALGLL